MANKIDLDDLIALSDYFVKAEDNLNRALTIVKKNATSLPRDYDVNLQSLIGAVKNNKDYAEGLIPKKVLLITDLACNGLSPAINAIKKKFKGNVDIYTLHGEEKDFLTNPLAYIKILPHIDTIVYVDLWDYTMASDYTKLVYSLVQLLLREYDSKAYTYNVQLDTWESLDE